MKPLRRHSATSFSMSRFCFSVLIQTPKTIITLRNGAKCSAKLWRLSLADGSDFARTRKRPVLTFYGCRAEFNPDRVTEDLSCDGQTIDLSSSFDVGSEAEIAKPFPVFADFQCAR